MRKQSIIAIMAIVAVLASSLVFGSTEVPTSVVKDYDIYINNPDGSICGGTYMGEPGNYAWDCWYPW